MINVINANLIDMTVEEAKKFGIPEDQRQFYYKMEVESSMTRSEPPKWFHTVMVDLKDGGDLVPVAERWYPPK